MALWAFALLGWRRTLVLAVLLLAASFVAGFILRDRMPWQSDPRPELFSQTDGVLGVYVLPDDGREPILREIEAAQTSVTLQVYLLGDEVIIDALVAAVDRGVDVRVLLEEHPFGGAGTEEEIYDRLERNGVAVRWGDPVFRFSHVKTFVLDRHVAIIMNQNLTRSSFDQNREFFAITTRSDEVRQAAMIFDADWNRTGAEIDGPLLVSPVNSRTELLGLIDGATETLDIYAEVVRDEAVVAALSAAERRGVAVRIIVSPDSAANDRGQAERASLARAGAEIIEARGFYIHAKMILADDARLYIGSQNFTATSLDLNREIGLLIEEPHGIARAAATFDADFTDGRAD